MPTTTPAHRASLILPALSLSPADLAAQGITVHRRRALLRDGRLLRARRGRYLAAGLPEPLVAAARLGARLDCVSLLRALGIYALGDGRLHVQVERGSSRLPCRGHGVAAHWRPSSHGRAELAADLIEALAQAVRCQPVRDGLATLENAWHHGLIDEAGVSAVFARLPRRYRRVRGLLDRRAESGPETIMRLMLRALGCDVQVQVKIPGVGRVDLVVDGWLIVECDSRAHHEGWEAERRDRRRDLAAATLGYTTVRPLAEDIQYHRASVQADMKLIVAHGPRRAETPNSSRTARRAATRR